MRFDLTDLRLFLAVVDAGSITHGAERVGLSLPAASERLREMEATGQVKLLERGRRGVVPTQAGEALAHHARLIQRQMAEMRGELGEHAKGIRATVRLAANTAAMTEFLPERLGPWLAAHPHVNVEMKERQSIEIAKAVAADLVDIGILSDAVDTSGLILHPFAVDQLIAVAPREHAIAKRRHIAFSDILDEHFIGLAGGALQDHVESHAAKAGTRLKIRIRLRTFEGLCRLVADGVGLGIMPEAAARRCEQTMKIVGVPLTDAWARRQLSVCVRDEKKMAAPARDLFSHLARGG